MADLSETQKKFIDRYVMRGRLAALGVDAPEGERPEGGQEGEAALLRDAINQLSGARDVSPQVQQKIIGLAREASALLIPPLAGAEIRRATGLVAQMRDLHAEGLRDIEARKVRAGQLRGEIDRCKVENASEPEAALLKTALEEIAKGWGDPPTSLQLDTASNALPALKTLAEEATKGRDTRAEEGRTIAANARKAQVEHAATEEAGELDQAREKVLSHLPDWPSAEQIGKAKQEMEVLGKAVERIAKAVEDRGREAGLLRDRVNACIVEEADTGETEELGKARGTLAVSLAGVPGAGHLQTVTGEVAALELRKGEIAKAVSDRKLRRDEVVKARDAAVPNAVTAEAKRLEELRKTFPDLTGAPSRETMTKAEDALLKLEPAFREVTAAVKGRVDFAGRMVLLLDGIVWGQGTLAPHEAAPAGLADPLKEQVGKAVTERVAYRDPAKAESWPSIDPKALAEVEQQATGAKQTVEKAVAEVNAAVTRIAEAAGKAKIAIAATSIRKLDDGQAKVLTELVDAAVKRLVKALSEETSALDGIAEALARATTLQRALRGLDQRIAAVNLTPAGASDVEKGRLDTLRKQAVEALAKVDA